MKTLKSLFIGKNRLVLRQMFNVFKLFRKLMLPFRGHDESANSCNKGVFKEFIQFLSNNGDNTLADDLKYVPHNALYLSPEI